MNIVVVGTGYVGLVTGTCLAESGNNVTCLDKDSTKIGDLQDGRLPIYEPGLFELVQRNQREGRLHFSQELTTGLEVAQLVFIAVGTPQGADGHPDLSNMWAVTDVITTRASQGAIVVIKSTVPVGTHRRLRQRLIEGGRPDLRVVSNPEFLKEGAAVDDFMRPDRIVIGGDEGIDVLQKLYAPFLRTERPFLVMSPESAEMTKYVANAMLATKISFINEMANLCERMGADINDIRRGIGHDARIGFQFLFPGAGYGGSCFPKDVRALISTSDQLGMPLRLLSAVEAVNEWQKQVLFRKICGHFAGALRARKLAIWGLSFKPRTDDIREAPALPLLDSLLKEGAVLRVHDPEAMAKVRALYGERLTYCTRAYDALQDADGLVLVTEWQEFRNPDFGILRRLMNKRVIFDGRNVYDLKSVASAGFTYYGIGREHKPACAD
jgi:UDPglucose 6-dehydrogenase